MAARVLALRIGTVKNSKNFFLVDGPARSMRIGAGKVWAATTASSESDIAAKRYTKGSPFAAAKSFAQVSRENNPSMFVSAVGTTCQRWDEDIHRMLNETSSPKITVSIRKNDLDYILPALNAEATEFGFRADQTSDLERAKSFRANQHFCSFLVQSLQCQIPSK
jgi:hypothetical protein